MSGSWGGSVECNKLPASVHLQHGETGLPPAVAGIRHINCDWPAERTRTSLLSAHIKRRVLILGWDSCPLLLAEDNLMPPNFPRPCTPATGDTTATTTANISPLGRCRSFLGTACDLPQTTPQGVIILFYFNEDDPFLETK